VVIVPTKIGSVGGDERSVAARACEGKVEGCSDENSEGIADGWW
jgi:hypothetical protein